MFKRVAIATAVSGTLDILFAMILTVARGRHIGDMLRFVASGPFPQAVDMGSAGALLGLAVHYGLMTIMAAVFFAAVKRWPSLLERPYVAGLVYGLITYVVLDLVVVPVRFGSPLPPPTLAIVTQLFAHIVLVGMVFAWVARRSRSDSAR